MGHASEMAGKDKVELLYTYKGMIESPNAMDNGRVIYPELEAKR